MSLKVKLTALYTFFMICVTCCALAVLFSLSSREILALTQDKLEKRVQDSTDSIFLADGKLDLDSDFYSVTQDVYISLYDENMYFLYGKIPYGFNSAPEFADGRTRTIRDGDTKWYVYDMSFRLSRDDTVYLRGITSVTNAEESFAVTLRFAVFLLPLLIAVTAFTGYRFTRRTLLPVKRITETVEEIRADTDLSRRIGVKKKRGRKKYGDEIYNLALTFDRMLDELEQAFLREKQFTSDVSHELRTPVSVILAQCAECLRDKGLSEEQRNAIMVIRKKTGEISEMITHLLFLSRADQGRQKLEKENLNLSELTWMAVEEQQLLAGKDSRKITVSGEIQPEVYGWADETLYIRMLINLISNAVAYGRENGHVIVSLSCSDGKITGCVKDDGEGIAPEHMPHIWERFYRGDASRQKKDGAAHSGLGLAMVKWIAEAHGGHVTAESVPGRGSTFTFVLPQKSEKN